MSAALIRKLGQAHERLQQGDAAGAQLLCQEILQRFPRNPDALSLLGITYLMTGHAREAVPPLQQAVSVQPRHGAAFENLGLAHLMLGEFAAAERVLRNAAALPGAPASVWMRLGASILNQGRHAEALQEFNRALALDPQNPDIHLNLGQAMAQLGNAAAARRHFDTVLQIIPAHADAMFNLGVLELGEQRLDEARMWFERSLAQAPRHTEALVNLGVVHEREQRLDKAIGCFRRALEINPLLAQARNNLARAYALYGLTVEAREQYLAALRTAPDLTEAHEGLASVCVALGQSTGDGAYFDEAHAAAQRASALDPAAAGPYSVLAEIYFLRGELDRAVATLEAGLERTDADRLLGMLAFWLRYICAWEKWREAWRKTALLLDHSAELGNPFSLLCEPTTPRQQLAYARRWTQTQFGRVAGDSGVPGTVRATQPRMRIGYLSGDFRQHAISDLLVEVLELHDRRRFEIFAYSFGPDDHSLMRARVANACEHFIDIARESDDVAATRIRDDGIDILIDLNGHIRGARTGVLARRPCATQISWVGYPGTMGAEFIDYLIADPFVVPPGRADAYSECVLRMPHCYLPSDRQREVEPALTRAEYGLPDTGFIFCCFNQAYKITPEIFACWMRLLDQVPHSVLWMPDDNRWATDNLTRAALAHGIAPERLRFAPRLPRPAQHLARYRAADLALDTFPYASHTTACDALWAGCLLVGLCGETFAARVSGSILTACDLPELVTYSLEDYERLALRIATDSPYRDALRARLASAKSTAPLFDSTAFARNLERHYANIARHSAD